MIHHARQLALCAVISGMAFLGCVRSLPQDTFNSAPERGSLLYVEARSARDGLTAGQFGDIVMANIATGNRRLLTRDAYYDASPSWSPDCSEIIFESKRNPKGSRIFDLSKPSNLYLLDLESRRIEQFDDKIPANDSVGVNNRLPAWDTSGNKISFLSDKGVNAGLVLTHIAGEN